LADTAQVAGFLKRRYARAIERGDDRTATRLRAEIDRLINDHATDGARGGDVVERDWWQSTKHGQIEPAIDYCDILGPHL
jgi:hypothetical protein